MVSYLSFPFISYTPHVDKEQALRIWSDKKASMTDDIETPLFSHLFFPFSSTVVIKKDKYVRDLTLTIGLF